jgi:hypothetical protein
MRYVFVTIQLMTESLGFADRAIVGSFREGKMNSPVPIRPAMRIGEALDRCGVAPKLQP